MKPTELRVTPEEIKEAYFHIRKDEGDALRFAAQRITSFHERQRLKTWMYQDHEATLGQVVTPVDAVGVYVPGGKAVYPSSVLMCAIPAKVAGVSRVVMCTPPQKGPINPICWSQPNAGVTEIFASGACKTLERCLWDPDNPTRRQNGAWQYLCRDGQAANLRHRRDRMVAGPSELLIAQMARQAGACRSRSLSNRDDEDAQV